MKKRLLAMVLALVLVFSLLPGVAIAEGEEHIHCMCGANTEKDTLCAECETYAVVWTAWDGTTAPSALAAGYYYLTADLRITYREIISADIAIDLCGHDIYGEDNRAFYINGATMSITDCTDVEEEIGQIRNFANEANNGAIGIAEGGTLNIYGGLFTDNTSTQSACGVINVASGATLNMYGGEISGNTAVRGTIKGGTTAEAYWINIYGGTITGNHATGTGNLGGGAGIYSFTPVTIGGDAKVFGNTGEDANKNQDIFLRNDGSYVGQIVISDDKPLEKGAQINYGLWTAEEDEANLQLIAGTPTNWKNVWVNYEGQKVGYDHGTFFVDDGPADVDDGIYEGGEGEGGEGEGGEVETGDHIHCLCGAVTTEGETCDFCGEKAVKWTAWGENAGETSTLPLDGHYYLTEDISTVQVEYKSGNTAICLNGHDISTPTGYKIITVFNTATVSLCECKSVPGKITGSNKDTYGLTLRVNEGGVLNMYGGHVTGNSGTAAGDGVIYVDKGTAVAGGTFNMYGGEISGNTARRGGGVYTASGGTNPATVRILGGTITGNHSTGTGSTGGGGGILSFYPVEIGGNATVSGNTSALAGGEDIFLRNDGTFTGSLVVSADKPLSEGAQISYNLKDASKEDNTSNLQFISGSPTAWDSSWVSYNGEKVGYKNGKFFIDNGEEVSDHIHCMCGAEKTEGNTCASCGTEAVQWKGITAMPKANATGYYYLKSDITATTYGINKVGQIAFCLCGHTMTSANGKRLFEATGGSTISFTDCAEEVGMITGATGASSYGMLMRANANCTINIYNGKISGNHGDVDGVIYAAEGTTELPGGTINIYGGEISGNTCKRGTVYTALGTGGKLGGMIRILGGTITGNTGTGTGNIGGGAGVYTFYPIELGGDAKIYGNTAAVAPADLYVRDDQAGCIELSDTTPLTDGANIVYGTKGADNEEDLQLIVGEPDEASWNNSWVTYDGRSVKYKDGKFYTALDIVISGHDHGGHSWISMTKETQLEPTKTGYYVLDGDVKLSKQITLSGAEVTICLNGHTLTAADGVGHFDLQAGTKLTICDCTAKTSGGKYTAGSITGGYGAQGGFARMREGSELYLYDGKITGNETPGNGGVVYMNAGTSDQPGAKFVMYGGELSKNYGGYGGAVRLGAPSGDNKAGTFRMEGGVICDNESPNYGGALHAAGNATIELIGGVIENNVAKQGGGGLSINGTTTVNLSGTTVRNNSATTWGGGIYIKAGAVMDMTGGEVSGNSSKVGAGILLESKGTTLNLSGGKITANHAGAAGGAGLYASFDTIVNMTGGEVSNNISDAAGGGMVLAGAIGNLTGGKITGNKSASGGAGLRLTGTETYLGNIIISDNVSDGSAGGVYVAREGSRNSNVIIDGAQIINNTCKGSGGGLFAYMNGNTVTMKSGKINNNRAADGGGVVVQREITFTLEGGEICSNTATANGGGYYASIDSTFIMKGGLISGNYAGKGGGGVYCLRSKVYLNMGSISNNVAETGSAGGVRVSCATIELNGTWITDNKTLDASGGGVMVSSTTMKVDGVPTFFPSTITITGGRIAGNFTPRAGGGLLLQSKGTVCHMYGGKITENVATKFGAGVYVGTKTEFNMHGGEVSYNVTENDVAAGIRFDGGAGNLTGGEIHHNVSPRSGGGFIAGGTNNKVTMKNVKIYANEAKVGGGFVQQSKGCQLIMENCEIYDNKATQEGAGAYIYTYCDYYATDCKFYDNVCQGNGGGLWSWATSYVYLTNCTMENNVAKGQGGAIWTRNDGFFIDGCTIKNNSADGDGGAIYAGRMSAASDGFKPHMNISNTVIEGNTSGGQGGGAYMSTGAMCRLTNVSFLNNTAAAEAGAIWAIDEFYMESVTATGNKSGGEGYAVYLDDSDYDGFSYINGLMEMCGNMQIHDNPGGDLYLGKQTCLSITDKGISEDAKVNVTLHSGLLTQLVWGEYNYEGGDLNYTITYGNRSIVDPEIPTAEPEAPVEDPGQSGDSVEDPTQGEKNEPKGKTGLYVGIGAVVAVIAAAAVIIVAAASKKKKVTK